MLNGQKGFFQPRFPPPSSILPGSPDTASYYDTAALKDTLERLCDFDRINSGKQQVSVGAVNVRNGNFVYFDNTNMKLRAEHFMASGALPPAFAAEIGRASCRERGGQVVWIWVEGGSIKKKK